MTTSPARRRAALIGVPLALVSLLSTTAAGCGSSTSKASGGSTVMVPGATNEIVTCTEQPYSHTAQAVDENGSGVSVAHGIVRGSIWVSCNGGAPDTFQIIVILVRDGQEVGKGSQYSAAPNEVGYEAWTITGCVPGTYHLYYRYVWTLEGGVQQNTKTTTAKTVVTAHDCDQ